MTTSDQLLRRLSSVARFLCDHLCGVALFAALLIVVFEIGKPA